MSDGQSNAEMSPIKGRKVNIERNLMAAIGQDRSQAHSEGKSLGMDNFGSEHLVLCPGVKSSYLKNGLVWGALNPTPIGQSVFKGSDRAGRAAESVKDIRDRCCCVPQPGSAPHVFLKRAGLLDQQARLSLTVQRLL